jgi:hypothetical protein
LITSPLEWQMTAAPVPPPVIPVLAERGGTQLKPRVPFCLWIRASRIHFISPGLRDGSVASKRKRCSCETIPLLGWKRSAPWSARIYRIWYIPAPLIVVPSLIDCEQWHDFHIV